MLRNRTCFLFRQSKSPNPLKSFRIETFNSQELANSSWACAKLAYLNESLFNSIASMCRAEQIERIFVPQDFANIAWSFAKAIYVKVPVLLALCSRAAGCIPEFNHQDLANMAWAMANLLLRNEKLMGAIAEHAEERQDMAGYCRMAVRMT